MSDYSGINCCRTVSGATCICKNTVCNASKQDVATCDDIDSSAVYCALLTCAASHRSDIWLEWKWKMAYCV